MEEVEQKTRDANLDSEGEDGDGDEDDMESEPAPGPSKENGAKVKVLVSIIGHVTLVAIIGTNYFFSNALSLSQISATHLKISHLLMKPVVHQQVAIFRWLAETWLHDWVPE